MAASNRRNPGETKTLALPPDSLKDRHEKLYKLYTANLTDLQMFFLATDYNSLSRFTIEKRPEERLDPLYYFNDIPLASPPDEPLSEAKANQLYTIFNDRLGLAQPATMQLVALQQAVFRCKHDVLREAGRETLAISIHLAQLLLHRRTLSDFAVFEEKAFLNAIAAVTNCIREPSEETCKALEASAKDLNTLIEEKPFPPEESKLFSYLVVTILLIVSLLYFHIVIAGAFTLGLPVGLIYGCTLGSVFALPSYVLFELLKHSFFLPSAEPSPEPDPDDTDPLKVSLHYLQENLLSLNRAANQPSEKKGEAKEEKEEPTVLHSYTSHYTKLRTEYLECQDSLKAFADDHLEELIVIDPLSYFKQYHHYFPENDPQKLRELRLVTKMMRSLVCLQEAIYPPIEMLEAKIRDQDQVDQLVKSKETWLHAVALAQNLFEKLQHSKHQYEAGNVDGQIAHFSATVRAAAALIKTPNKQQVEKLITATNHLNSFIEKKNLTPEESRLFRCFIGMLTVLAGSTVLAFTLFMSAALLPANVCIGLILGAALTGRGLYNMFSAANAFMNSPNAPEVVTPAIVKSSHQTQESALALAGLFSTGLKGKKIEAQQSEVVVKKYRPE